MIVVGTKPAQDVPEGVTDVVQLDFQDLTEHAPTEVQLLVKSDFAERMKFAMRSDGRPKVPAEVVFQITRHMREKNCSLATVVSVTFLDSTLSQQSWSQNADAVTPAPAPVRAAVPPPPANPAAGLPNATPNPAPVNPNPAPMNPVANAAPNPAPNAVAAPPAPNSASESQDGDNTLLYAIGGTVLGVGVLGVIAAIVMSSKPKKSNRTSRTNRNGPRVARRVREDEDDDDDDDDRPRRAKRVRD